MLTKTVIENIFIILGEGFWLSYNFAQLRKLVKTRNTKGLVAPTQTLNAAGNVAWAVYFATKHLWIPLSTNLGMLVLTVITIGYLLANKKQLVKAFASIAIIGPITAYILITSTGFSGWTGVIFNTISATPWLIHVIKTKKVSGLSSISLIFGMGAILCTLTYAILIGSVPLIVACIQGIGFFSIISIYYRRYSHF